MQTIRYIFSDGTTSEIEVTDEFYTLYAELVQQEKRNHWKETRRHISLNYLLENGKKQGAKRKILQFFLRVGFISVSTLEIIHCFSL